MKKNTGRHILAAVLFLAVCMALLAGCGEGKSTAKSVSVLFPNGTQIEGTPDCDHSGLQIVSCGDSLVLAFSREGTYTLSCREQNIGDFTLKVTCKDGKVTIDENTSDLKASISEQ